MKGLSARAALALVVTATITGACVATPAGSGAPPPESASPTDPGFECPAGVATVGIGDTIPITRRFSNPTDHEVTLTVQLAASALLGPARDVASVHLEAHLGRLMSSPVGVSTTIVTPLGQETVAFDLFGSETGDRVLQRCQVALTLAPPIDMPDLIQVPVRFCALEGSVLAGSRPPGAIVEAAAFAPFLAYLEQVNGTWSKQAHLVFTPPPGVLTAPVVRRTSRADVPPGLFVGLLGVDATAQGQACVAAWDAGLPGTTGMPVVVAREVDGAYGVTPGSSAVFRGNRRLDLCQAPRHLVPSDVSDQAVVVSSPSRLPVNEMFVSVLAHELGHALLLDHGNGRDDNGDAVPPPTPGARTFDDCDPLRAIAEDALAAPASCAAGGGSLMNPTVSATQPCRLLYPFQVERARDAALQYPGARGGALASGAAGPSASG